jgi:hypothetical protein
LAPPSRNVEAPRTIAVGDAPGWSGAEWAEHLREGLPEIAPLPPPVAGVVLLAPHASELALAPLARALAHLEHGERVRLVVPEALPALGEVWSSALAGRSGWQCIQDDGLGVLRAALAEPGVESFEASGPPARVAELERLYGRGTFTTLRNTSLVVRRADDAEELARVAARRAFSRVEALSGQRAGALGRVVCHERSFSRFSTALLAELERMPDFAEPVPLLERATRAHVSHARSLGLDEGATLVLSRKDPPACVFTNVDERLRLATLARCAGLLVLLRAASDEEGAALAARLDGDARAEDLG